MVIGNIVKTHVRIQSDHTEIFFQLLSLGVNLVDHNLTYWLYIVYTLDNKTDTNILFTLSWNQHSNVHICAT